MNTPSSSLTLHTDSIGNGPDLVILHGLFGSGENWRNQARKLAARYTVHSMDARNHGDSPHHPAMSYPLMANDVIATCQQLNLQRIHLLGHSMGGKTAMQVSLQMPDLIDQLIIVDIGPQQYPPHHDRILQGMKSLQQTSCDSRSAADAHLQTYVEDKTVRAFLLKNLQRTDTGDYRLKINVDAIASGYPSISAAVEADKNTSYDAPVLFIKGATSDYLRAEDRQSVMSIFPQARLKTIDGAGHWPHSEKPDVVFKIISDFLAQSSAT